VVRGADPAITPEKGTPRKKSPAVREKTPPIVERGESFEQQEKPGHSVIGSKKVKRRGRKNCRRQTPAT